MSAPKIEIYTRFGCGYCVRAKQLLDRKGVDYVEHDVTFGGNEKREMLMRVPNAVTVPQIILGGTPIGGCDDLYALDRAGKLDPMLGIE